MHPLFPAIIEDFANRAGNGKFLSADSWWQKTGYAGEIQKNRNLLDSHAT